MGFSQSVKSEAAEFNKKFPPHRAKYHQHQPKRNFLAATVCYNVQLEDHQRIKDTHELQQYYLKESRWQPGYDEIKEGGEIRVEIMKYRVLDAQRELVR